MNDTNMKSCPRGENQHFEGKCYTCGQACACSTIGKVYNYIAWAEQVYYTVAIPWEWNASKRTQWHPTESTGPFSVVIRGAFDTREQALTWAKANLPSSFYEIHEVKP